MNKYCPNYIHRDVCKCIDDFKSRVIIDEKSDKDMCVFFLSTEDVSPVHTLSDYDNAGLMSDLSREIRWNGKEYYIKVARW